MRLVHGGGPRPARRRRRRAYRQFSSERIDTDSGQLYTGYAGLPTPSPSPAHVAGCAYMYRGQCRAAN